MVFSCLFYSNNIQKEKKLWCCFSGGHFGCHLKYDIILQLAKNVSFISPITSLQDLIKIQTNIQTNIHFPISVIDFLVGNLYMVDILDAILNF